MSAHSRPPASALTARQEARRNRILAASTELACGGGFDAVQMREVAELSEVALGTLYRYFPSKIHLLVAVMEDQLGQLRTALRTRPPSASEPGARVADTLLRAFRALQREPLIADAMFRAMIFADRSARAQVDTVSQLTTAIIVEAMGRPDPHADGEPANGPAPAPAPAASADSGGRANGTTPKRGGGGSGAAEAGPDAKGAGEDRTGARRALSVADLPTTRASAVRVIEHTWHAALVSWISGRASVAEVTEDIRTACGLLDEAAPPN